MDRITLENYRCFREEQSAQLAPLTLLVGDNSTGKTSFLAMVRALWGLALGFEMPDFKEEPYDLGSFDEIVHRRGSRSGVPTTFRASLRRTLKANELSMYFGHDRIYRSIQGLRDETQHFQHQFTFGRIGESPVPVALRIEIAGIWVEVNLDEGEPYTVRARTNRGTWEMRGPHAYPFASIDPEINQHYFRMMLHRVMANAEKTPPTPLANSPEMNPDDLFLVERVIDSMSWRIGYPPFASGPVRSKPLRTYDPSRTTRSPQGSHVPMYLASIFSGDQEEWETIKSLLEEFGQTSGLFDEISIRRLGRKSSEPFQMQIRKFGKRLKGPPHNLIDVGYGVSQALPVVTELLRSDSPTMFLLQQPEVHLHPSAQAALGSLFCSVASTGKQLIVETHSDHLMDRVRMDVRDGVSDLRPEDVSILFFERDELDVRIHSLGIDEQGNITDAPQSYRRFFMEEVRRSLWA